MCSHPMLLVAAEAESVLLAGDRDRKPVPFTNSSLTQLAQPGPLDSVDRMARHNARAPCAGLPVQAVRGDLVLGLWDRPCAASPARHVGREEIPACVDAVAEVEHRVAQRADVLLLVIVEDRRGEVLSSVDSKARSISMPPASRCRMTISAWDQNSAMSDRLVAAARVARSRVSRRRRSAWSWPMRLLVLPPPRQSEEGDVYP